MQLTIPQLVELAKAVETNNPIDWGELPAKEDELYTIYAKAMYAAYLNTSVETKDITFLTAIISMHVRLYVMSETLAMQSKTISDLQKKK